MALKIFFNQHYIEIEYDYAVQPSPEDRLSSHLEVILFMPIDGMKRQSEIYSSTVVSCKIRYFQ